jgi:hypothetical protein
MHDHDCLPEPRGRAGISRHGRTVVVVLVILTGYSLCLLETGFTTATTVTTLAAVVAATAKVLALGMRAQGNHG